MNADNKLVISIFKEYKTIRNKYIFLRIHIFFHLLIFGEVTGGVGRYFPHNSSHLARGNGGGMREQRPVTHFLHSGTLSPSHSPHP